MDERKVGLGVAGILGGWSGRREQARWDEDELAVEPPQPESNAGRPVTVGRLRAADAQINAASTPGSTRAVDSSCVSLEECETNEAGR